MPIVRRGNQYYEIDNRGRAIPVTVAPSPSSPAITDDIPRIGRPAGIPVAKRIENVLDWRADDQKARAMRLMVGHLSDSVPFGFYPNLVPGGLPYPMNMLLAGDNYLSYPVEDFINPNVGVKVQQQPVAQVEFGVDGYTDSFVMDIVPAQSVTLVASFVRVQAYSPSMLNADLRVQAALVPDNGFPQKCATLSLTLLPGNAFGFSRTLIPRFAKSMRITRTSDGTGADLKVITGYGHTDTIPDPGVGKEYTVKYDGPLGMLLDLTFGAGANYLAYVTYEIQP